VQLEDKLVDGLEAAHAESRQREDIEDRGAETLPEPIIEAVANANHDQRAHLLGAIRMLLDGQSLDVGALHMPTGETVALEALQVATTGRGELGQFVYAEDRRDLLERALAVLQPDLSRADNLTARELNAQIADLAARVGEIRETLSALEDAQDEIESEHRAAHEQASDPDDKPKPTPSDPDAPRPASTLAGPGPQAPLVAPAPTTLTGTDAAEPAKPPTTLIGPELAEPPRPATSLVGPELAPEPVPATTLTGAELAPEAKPASSLGAAEDLAAAEQAVKRTWWRRPFG
jgi:hypothetical protein